MSAQTVADAPAPLRSVAIEANDPELAAARRALAFAATPENYQRVAEAYVRNGVLDLAFDHLSAGLRLAPGNGALHDGLARIWREWGFIDLALGSAYRAVYFGPDRAASQNTLGTILLQAGWDDAARAAFERAHQLEPQSAYIVNNLCYTALSAGDPHAAIAACTDALTIDPDLKVTRANLARAYAAAGDFESARREFAIAGSASQAQYQLGLAYLREGRLDAAAVAFQAAWEADRTLSAAGEQLRQLNARRHGARP